MSEAVLPDAEWRNASGLARVVAALADEHGGPRFVGGAVRDTLLGLQVTDVDLATMLLPEVVVDRLEAACIKAVPTGLDHGTVTAVADGKNYEITTLRRDVATDGRRAVVAFATDWKEDAARRDFTINALYADPSTGDIFDYFGGLEDLKTGNVRFIGDANERIAEDHLRILRYFRFLARFSKGPADSQAIAACAENTNSLMALSRERVAGELLKLLALPDPRRTISLMIQYRIFAPFLPEVADNAASALNRLYEREREWSCTPSLAARLLSLLPWDANTAQNVAMRLKLSNRMRADLARRLGGEPPTAKNVRAIAYRQGVDAARDSALLYADDADFASCMEMLNGWEAPEFAIKGGDLIARGLSVGPVVTQTLQAIENSWIAESFPPVTRINEIANQAVAEAMLASKKV